MGTLSFAATQPSELTWTAQAACRTSQSEHFYPAADDYRDEEVAAAKDVCRRCPVTVACLRHALLGREQFGVWGGMTPRERRRARLPRKPWPPVSGRTGE